eukprot:scaffold497_cov368-Prasinococcus_capsulatus_cf.AAC.5
MSRGPRWSGRRRRACPSWPAGPSASDRTGAGVVAARQRPRQCGHSAAGAAASLLGARQVLHEGQTMQGDVSVRGRRPPCTLARGQWGAGCTAPPWGLLAACDISAARRSIWPGPAGRGPATPRSAQGRLARCSRGAQRGASGAQDGGEHSGRRSLLVLSAPADRPPLSAARPGL